MTFTREQRQTAYKKLPEEVQSFVMSNETTELISKLLTEAHLTKEQVELADTEILNALVNLQTFDNAIANIATISQRKPDDLAGLKNQLQNEIFSKYPELGSGKEGAIVIKDQQTKEEVLQKLSPQETKEQAMQRLKEKMMGGTPQTAEAPHENLPMVEPGEKVHDVPHVESAPVSKPEPVATPEPKTEAPAPTAQPEKPRPQTPPTTTHYPSGQDPYREPIA